MMDISHHSPKQRRSCDEPRELFGLQTPHIGCLAAKNAVPGVFFFPRVKSHALVGRPEGRGVMSGGAHIGHAGAQQEAGDNSGQSGRPDAVRGWMSRTKFSGKLHAPSEEA